VLVWLLFLLCVAFASSQFLESNFLISHCSSWAITFHTISSHVAILHTLSLLLHYCSSCVVIPLALLFYSRCYSHVPVLMLQLCVALFTLQSLSCCHSFRTNTLFALLFSPCYFSHGIVPLTLFFSHHCAFQVFVNPTFVVFPMLSLLFLSRYYYVMLS